MRRTSEADKNLTDFDLNNKINLELFSENVEVLGNVCFRVFEGKVLLACSVKKQEEKELAERVIKKIPGIVSVYNHIQVGDGKETVDYVNDSYISTRLGWSLMFMGEILRDNYTFDVYRGVVYLLGKAPDDQLRRQVVDAARNISGVEKVVSYITLDP